MSKRFIDNEIWDKTWFMDLNPEEKTALLYLFSKCDSVGVWPVNFKLANFYIGKEIDWEKLLDKCNGNIEEINDKKWWIVDFCNFQYGELKKECIPHASYIKQLLRHGLYEKVTKNYSGQIGKSHNISDKTRKFIIQRDGKECAYCTKVLNNFDLVLDHIIPRIKGGSDKSDNLVISCKNCNAKKSDFDLKDFIKKMNFDEKEIIERVSQRVSITLKEKEKEKDKEKEKEDLKININQEIKIIIDYLNSKCNKNFTYKNKNFNSHINARLKEKFKVDNFKKVIDNKLKDKNFKDNPGWYNPETLFCPGHFEKYLNEYHKKTDAEIQTEIEKQDRIDDAEIKEILEKERLEEENKKSIF